MSWVIVGGAGFIGREICRALTSRGERFAVVDVEAPTQGNVAPWIRADVLTDDFELPPGRVVLAHGCGLLKVIRPWTLPLINAVSTARIAAQLRDREVTVLSSVEVYGSAPGPLHEGTAPQLPVDPARLADWVERALDAAQGSCAPHKLVSLCRRLVEADASGRWTYAVSKLAQEQILLRAVPPGQLRTLRLSNVVGAGQCRFLGRMVEALADQRECLVSDSVRSFVSVGEVARVVVDGPRCGLFNVASGTMRLPEVVRLAAEELGRTPDMRVVPASPMDSCGQIDASRLRALMPAGETLEEALGDCVRDMAWNPAPMFVPPIPVVVPPRPEAPDLVSERIAAGLWSGRVRGDRWSAALVEALTSVIRPRPGHRIVLTNSGTNALRLAVSAVARPRHPGDIALCPAFTFHATAEVLKQLGWTVRYVDVSPLTWTIDPHALAAALQDGQAGVVVAVDALGNPCDYHRIADICRAAGAPFVADSAPALGARYLGEAVGGQADAHAFSMSFAKTVSGGGSGGFAVLPDHPSIDAPENWGRSSLITEASAVVALDGVLALEALIERRQGCATIFGRAVEDLSGFRPQQVQPGGRHAWVHWAMSVPPAIGRNRLAAELASEGVGTKPYYEALADSADCSQLITTARLHRDVLALPMSSEINPDEAERIGLAVRRAVRRLSGRTLWVQPHKDAQAGQGLG